MPTQHGFFLSHLTVLLWSGVGLGSGWASASRLELSRSPQFLLSSCPAFLWGVAMDHVARLAPLVGVRSTALGWPEVGAVGVLSSLLLISHWPGVVTWPHLATREATQHPSYWMAVYPLSTPMGVVYVPQGCSNKIPRTGQLTNNRNLCLGG